MVSVLGNGDLRYYKYGAWWQVGFPADPRNISDLVGWWDAADASTITQSSGSVSQWNDKSGLNFHLTQATAAAQPTTGTRTVNGLNVLDFDGGDWLRNTAVAANQPDTVIIVWAPDSPLPNNQIPFDDDNNSGRQVAVGYGNGTIEASAGTVLNASNSFVAGLQMWRILFNGASSSTVVNGVEKATGNMGSNNLRGLTVGARFSATSLVDGTIAEVIIYNKQLSVAEATAIDNYLAAKWGVTLA